MLSTSTWQISLHDTQMIRTITMCCIVTLTSTLYKDFKRLKDEIKKKITYSCPCLIYEDIYICSKQICFIMIINLHTMVHENLQVIVYKYVLWNT